MDIQKCNDIYAKLYSLVLKEFELNKIPEPVLSFVIFETPSDRDIWYEAIGGLSNGGSVLSFLCAIEEEFCIEISDEVCEEMITFKDVFRAILNTKYNIDVEKYLELEIRKKSLKLMIFRLFWINVKKCIIGYPI